MRMRDRLLIGTIVAAGFLLAAGPLTLPTQAQTPAALTGQVTSAEEGAMGTLPSRRIGSSPATTR